MQEVALAREISPRQLAGILSEWTSPADAARPVTLRCRRTNAAAGDAILGRCTRGAGRISDGLDVHAPQ